MEQLILENVDIDRVKTAKNVRGFFQSELKQWCLLAGQRGFDISSPAITGVAASPNGNGQEKKTINQLTQIEYAENVLAAVYTAITYCDYESQIILDYVYLRHWNNVKLKEKLPYEDRALDKRKQEACCQFAEGLMAAKEKCNCKKLRDLVIRKK